MMELPVDDSLAHVTFRLCRMMLARKVLWDQDIGFAAPELARALSTTTEVVEEVLGALEREGWIVRSDGARLALTERGTAAILGRGSAGGDSGGLVIGGDRRPPHRATGAIALPTKEPLRG